MPVYVHKCEICGNTVDSIRKVADYDRNFPQCCGQDMPRVICAPAVMNDMEAYRSPVDGSIVNSRSDHREHMKRHRLIEVGNEKLKPHQKEYKADGLKDELIKAAYN